MSKLKSNIIIFRPINENDQRKITLIQEITDLKQKTLKLSTGASGEFVQLTMICILAQLN